VHRLPSILLLTAFCLSCTPAEHYHPLPTQAIPRHWNAPNRHLVEQTKPLACIAWWKQFNDPTLDALIAQGIKENNALQTAIANIDAAQGALKAVKLNWIPTLDGVIGYSSFPYLGYPGVLATIVPSYTLNFFKQVNQQALAHYQLAEAKKQRDTVKLAIIAQITGNYFAYLAQLEQLRLIHAIDNDLTTQVQIKQATQQGELISAIPLVKQQSELTLIKAEEQVIKQNIVIHQNQLRYLLNENPQAFQLKQRFSHLSTQQLIIGAIPLHVVENRPDLAQATQALQAANVGVDLAVSNFLPTLQLSAARGDIAKIDNGTSLGKPIYFNQSLASNPLINLSLFGQLDQAHALNKASYYRYLDTLRSVLRDVNTDLSAEEYYRQRLDQARDASAYLKRVYTLSSQLYEQGIISFSDLLREKIKWEKVQLLVNQYKREQLISLVNLYQNLALGYGCLE
jgi:outer membrane protein TolC